MVMPAGVSRMILPLRAEARAAGGGAGGGQLPVLCPMASVCLHADGGRPGHVWEPVGHP